MIEEQEKLIETKIQQLQTSLKYEERSDFEEKSKQSDKDESVVIKFHGPSFEQRNNHSYSKVINDERSDESFASKTTDSMTKISTTANIKSTKSKLRAIHRFRRSKSTDSEQKSTVCNVYRIFHQSNVYFFRRIGQLLAIDVVRINSDVLSVSITLIRFIEHICIIKNKTIIDYFSYLLYSNYYGYIY